MDEGFLLLLGWVGVFAPIALGAVGSVIGCTRGGQAACGAMLDQEGGYGRFVAAAALPASQTIYGVVITLLLNGQGVSVATAPGLFGIGVLGGIGLLASAMGQGACCASAIAAFKSKPEIFGLSIAPAAIVEGFALFVLAFALYVAGTMAGTAPGEEPPAAEKTQAAVTATENPSL